MLPALGLYAGGLFLRLSATATLGGKTVWNLAPKNEQLHTGRAFGVVRHPIYLGSAAMIFGLSLISSPQGAALLLGLDIPLLLLFAWLEERYLSVTHPEYADYKKRIPALLPRPPFPKSSMKDAWNALGTEGGRALRSEAANVALLGGFIAFWLTPDLRFFWGSAGLALILSLTAPVWEKLIRGHP